MFSKQNRQAEDNPYQPQPESIVVLASALGLDTGAETLHVKKALESLLHRGEQQGNLSPEGKDALVLIRKATTPEPGTIDFHEVRLVSHGGTVATPRDVLAAVMLVRQELENGAVALPKSPHGGPAHISELLSRAHGQQTEQELRQIAGLTKAITYLQENWILPPVANKNRSPSPEVTQALARHGMTWVWKDETQSWDPRLDTGRNQSLFTAAPKYFEHISGLGAPTRQKLIENARNAREVEDKPELRARRSQSERELVGALIRTAEDLLQCPEVSLPRLMRIQALYRFFVDTATEITQ